MKRAQRLATLATFYRRCRLAGTRAAAAGPAEEPQPAASERAGPGVVFVGRCGGALPAGTEVGRKVAEAVLRGDYASHDGDGSGWAGLVLCRYL